MKRPLVYAAVTTICGTACGIGESSAAVRLTAGVTAFLTFLFFLINSYSHNKISRTEYENSIKYAQAVIIKACRKNTLLIFISLSLFLSAFFRSIYVSYKYNCRNSAESTEIYEKYKASNPGQFDYAMYLKAMGVYDTESFERYMRRRPGKEGGDEYDNAEVKGYEGYIESIRLALKQILDDELTKEDAGIYKAVLLGDKNDMSEDITKLYRTAGISHLLAVSGLHVGIIGLGLFRLIRLMSIRKRTASAISSAAVIFYMLLCGSSGSTLRAVIMLISAFAAADQGRSGCMRSSLAAAAIISVYYKPYIICTAGFQLSFGAVIGIVYTGELMLKGAEKLLSERHVRKKYKLPGFLKTVIVSIAIQLTLLPVMAWHYFVFPVYGVLLNLIVIPLMGIVVCSGLAVLFAGISMRLAAVCLHGVLPAAVSGGLHPAKILTALCVAPGHYILKLYEYLCTLFTGLPYAEVCVGRPDMTNIVIYYILLFMILHAAAGTMHIMERIRLFSDTGRPDTNIRAAELIRLCVFTAAIIINADMLKYRDKSDFNITALDVGQGDCFVIKAYDNYILVDGGSSSVKNVGERILEPYLLSKRITDIELAAVSHADTDHTNGIKYLMSESENINIEIMALPQAAVTDADYDELKELFIKGAKKTYKAEWQNKHDEQNKSNRNDKDSLKSSAFNLSQSEKYDEIIYLKDDMTVMKCNDISLTAIYGGNAKEQRDNNRESAVLLLDKNDEFTMLFTGDMPSEEDEAFISCFNKYLDNKSNANGKGNGNDKGNIKDRILEADFGSLSADGKYTDSDMTKKYESGGITVLKAAHHGSKTSSSDRFLNVVRPEYAVLSYGKNNRYGHPSPEVTDRMAKRHIRMLSTCDNGALYINEKGIFAAK